MSGVVDILSDSIQRRRLFAPGERILVAVSGGLDSMVLLRALQALAPQNGWQLTVAHLNHQLRGRSSKADERLVRRTADALGLPVVIDCANVRQISRTQKLSLEMAARQARHQFLARTAARLDLSVIALAHHSDDQLELFLLRLLRGSGAQGLLGMKWKSPSPVAVNVKLVRPLLNLSKAALRDYAVQHKVEFRDDATNACLDILRNRIRHQLLPLLITRYQAALAGVVNRTLEILGAESDFVEASAAQWLQSRPGSGFEDLHVAVQRRVIQAQLIDLGVDPDYELVEKLRLKPETRVSVSRRGKEAGSVSQKGLSSRVKREFCVMRDKTGHLRLTEMPHSGELSFQSGELSCTLAGQHGSTEFGGLRFRWKFTNGTGASKLKRLAGRELFDADKIGERVFLRHWRPGDHFQPIGMPGAVKLQDLFTNQRIPAATRRKLVLATTGDGELFWIEGLRISERFKLTSNTIRRLHWAWERL